MSEIESPLQRFVRERLAETGQSGRAASLAGDLKPDFIRDILNGTKRSINGANIAKLAKGLRAPVEMVQANLPYTENLPYPPPNTLQTINFRKIVPVLGDLRRGAWLQAGGPEMPDESRVITSRDERYADLEQYARRLSDDSIDLIYPKGAILIYAAADRVGIRPGSLLIVSRKRANGECEVSAWQAQLREGRLILTTASQRLDVQEVAPVGPHGDVVSVTIEGVVISGMLDAPGLQGPMIPPQAIG